MRSLVYWPKLSWDVKQYVTAKPANFTNPKASRKATTNSGLSPLGNAGDGSDGSLPQEFQQKSLPTCFCGLLLKVGGALLLKESYGGVHISHPHPGDFHSLGNTRLRPF